ncbi:hypothetical protein DFS34DRAFT_27452 [Phlyctochytrium arcticum]|nr:hypothetical protein DFS34DRAFT_27452 [Phlyctochytrium arcticum]
MVSFVDTLPTLIDRPSSDIFASNGFSIPHPPSLNLLQLIQPIEQSHDSNFYCAPCKRAFSSQSTWRTHQGTARHLTITKENQRKRERTPKRSRSQAQSPALVEANLKLQQAEKLVSSNPHLAATIFWGIAAVFWSNGCVRDTAKCLTNLMSILDSDTGPAPGPTSPGREPPMALKPSQILETLYLARLTLARLMAMYDCDVAMALYLEALDGRYDTDLDALSLKCEDSAFLEVCSAAQETYLGKVEPKLMKSKKLASKSTVPVLEVQSALGLRKRKLASILLECLGFAVNLEAHDEALAVGALYLAVISGVDSMESEFTSCCARLADVSQKLGLTLWRYMP